MSAQASAFWLAAVANVMLLGSGATLTITATSTSASPSLTAVGGATGLAIGSVVVTPVAAAGKTVIAIDNAAHTATLSGNAGVTITGPFVFSPPVTPLALEVGLFTGTPTLSPGTLLSDLSQPTYAGYATQTPTIGAIRGDAAGDVIIPLGTSTWQPTGVVSPEQESTGFFVATAAGQLLFSEFLSSPWIATGVLSALDLIDEVYIPAESVWGGICTTCSPV